MVKPKQRAVARAVARGRGKLTHKIQWRVNSKGKFKLTPRSSPPWHRVKGINWVVGKSLDRIKLLRFTPPVARGMVPPVGTEAWVTVKFPTESQKTKGCDRCGGFHRKSNAECAATLGIPTPLNDPNALYDFATGEKLKTGWIIVSESQMPRARTALRTYRRVV